ncbi:MAG: acyl-CoA dehydrogenase family protein [Myxococcota bacterium]|jgi:alkylation response protein AidB-like acyl-CoA dehydrogenase|nr:acyl-CoA dehydrogenase family protein [Myxococcota bacterium]
MSPLEVMTVGQRNYLQDWQGQCHAAGLIGCDYPESYGGGGHTNFQAIANHELGNARVPFMINTVGLSMAAPTILVHGSEEQKRGFIPGALSGAEIWCQGFSEPGAGSDMANQQTMAVAQGDDWIVNGHKVWTTLGHFAEWMILITRTRRHHKYDGLTYFLAPIAGHPGVTVRPLVKMTGESGFNEVLFEDAVIPDSYRLDDIGKGWTVAMTTLTYERGAAESAGGSGGAILRPGSRAHRSREGDPAQRRSRLQRSRDPGCLDAACDRHAGPAPERPPSSGSWAMRPPHAPPTSAETGLQREPSGQLSARCRNRRGGLDPLQTRSECAASGALARREEWPGN